LGQGALFVDIGIKSTQFGRHETGNSPKYRDLIEVRSKFGSGLKVAIPDQGIELGVLVRIQDAIDRPVPRLLEAG
jgi:hypothetical protein